MALKKNPGQGRKIGWCVATSIFSISFGTSAGSAAKLGCRSEIELRMQVGYGFSCLAQCTKENPTGTAADLNGFTGPLIPPASRRGTIQ